MTETLSVSVIGRTLKDAKLQAVKKAAIMTGEQVYQSLQDDWRNIAWRLVNVSASGEEGLVEVNCDFEKCPGQAF